MSDISCDECGGIKKEEWKQDCVCELRKRIEELKEALSSMTAACSEGNKRIEELEIEVDGSTQAVEAALNGMFITREQINAAWGFADIRYVGGRIVELALKELGIVRCEGCKGKGQIFPTRAQHMDCNGDGWVLEADNYNEMLTRAEEYEDSIKTGDGPLEADDE